MKFKWEGFTAGGQVRTGEEEAESREIAIGNLKQKGFYVQKIVDGSEPLNPVLPQPEAPREIVPLDIPQKPLPAEFDLEEARKENARIAAGGVKTATVPAPLDDVFGSAVPPIGVSESAVKTPCPDKTPCEGEGCSVPRQYEDWQLMVNRDVDAFIDLCNYLGDCMPGESFNTLWAKMEPALFNKLVNDVIEFRRGKADGAGTKKKRTVTSKKKSE